MRAGIRIYGILIMALLAGACGQGSAPASQAKKTSLPVAKAPGSQVYYDSLTLVLKTYADLTTAFATEDGRTADRMAARLEQQVDSLPLQVLTTQPDMLKELQGITGSISAELVGLAGETTLQNKRDGYKMVSDMLFDLLTATGLPPQHTIYRNYCAVVFDHKGAYWLSAKTDFENPYLGGHTPADASIVDSLR